MKLKERKATELRLKTVDELADSLVTLKREQFNLRFRKAQQQVTDTSRSRWVRRQIARIQSVLGEKKQVA
ncbi:MAG: 50S ribosomal protein L29 [Alphaproteobacteria bacterium]|jgi:large subunit ribosomal protein L29|nr:50S ribosomal protein L29 [Thalassospira sp.]MCE2965110.1 50S ribosomal protein L29 [Alphaproteobacteria bacterium]